MLGPPDSTLGLSASMRRAISTTKAMESLNSSRRKVLKGRGAFLTTKRLGSCCLGGCTMSQKVDPADPRVESASLSS